MYNTLDDVTEIMTKEQYIESIKEKDDISQVKEQLADFQSIILPRNMVWMNTNWNFRMTMILLKIT